MPRRKEREEQEYRFRARMALKFVEKKMDPQLARDQEIPQSLRGASFLCTKCVFESQLLLI